MLIAEFNIGRRFANAVDRHQGHAHRTVTADDGKIHDPVLRVFKQEDDAGVLAAIEKFAKMNTGQQEQVGSKFWRQYFLTDYFMHADTSTIDAIVAIEGAHDMGRNITDVAVRETVQPCLSLEDEDELLEAMAEIDRGEFALAADVLESLRKYG